MVHHIPGPEPGLPEFRENAAEFRSFFFLGQNQQAQEVFHREAPWVPLAHSVVVQPMRRNVEGYRMSPFGTVQFDGVSLK